MEKVRICFTSPSLNGYSETFIQNIKNGLEGKIFHCYGGFFPYLTLHGNIQNSNTPPLRDLILKKLGIINQPLQEFYLSRYLKKNRINVIFANYGPSGAVLAPLASRLGIPLIVHFHGFDSSVYSILEKYKKGYSEMFEIAKAIIVVSEEMKFDLIRIGAPEHKIHKITCAPHPRFLTLSPNFKNNQILAIGRFVEKKAPHLTLLAFKLAKEKCPDLKLKFFGDGELLAVCKDLCLALGITDVSFPGVIDINEVADEMTRSFCFVQHSKQASTGDKEGTPVAILEALAAGLPVVSTIHAGIPDVLQDAHNGFLVEEGDVKGMADRIVLLAQNFDLAKELGNNGRFFALNNLDFEQYLAKLNQIIGEAIIK